MEKEQHITLLGILHIVRGGLILLIGLLAFAFLAGIGSLTGDATAMSILGFLGIVAVVFMGILAIPSILAGVGLLQRQAWGRILALGVGFISLIDVPIGTALGVYTIWVLLDDSIRPAFASGPKPQSLAVR